MKKSTKALLITAASLVLTGCILFAAVMSALKWDFTKLSTDEYKTNISKIDETFSNISVSVETADFTFAPSDDGKCRVECYEEKKEKHAVTVKNDTLIIKAVNRISWYDYIGFFFDSPKITVYLPKTEYNALLSAEVRETLTYLKIIHSGVPIFL